MQTTFLGCFKKKFTTTLDDQLIKQAKIRAIEENISVAELIEKLLKNYLADK